MNFNQNMNINFQKQLNKYKNENIKLKEQINKLQFENNQLKQNLQISQQSILYNNYEIRNTSFK